MLRKMNDESKSCYIMEDFNVYMIGENNVVMNDIISCGLYRVISKPINYKNSISF